MATTTLGTNSTSSLTALAYGGGPVAGGGDTGYSEADIAAIAQLILDPHNAKQGVVPTGTTTTSSASVTSLSSVAGIRAGMWIFGAGIPPGTTVVSVGASSLVMSAAITGSGSGGVNLLIVPQGPTNGFSKMGLLYVPNRGVLKVYPGDMVGVDASGFPILVAAEAIAFANTSWTT
jgi:hypothetical protein